MESKKSQKRELLKSRLCRYDGDGRDTTTVHVSLLNDTDSKLRRTNQRTSTILHSKVNIHLSGNVQNQMKSLHCY